MNKFKKQKMNKRNKKLEEEIKNHNDLDNKIYYLESLKLCTQSNAYKKQIDNQIKNIIRRWESKGNVYYESY